MKRLGFIACAAALTVVTTGGLLAGCQTNSCCCKKGCVKKMTNKDFYVGGTFDANGINKGGKFDAAIPRPPRNGTFPWMVTFMMRFCASRLFMRASRLT